jgi:prolipoprotein diacylglyceryltransferase
MVWDLLVYLIIGGVLGARLWHILTPPPSSIAQGFTTQFYLTHPLDALAIWKGGLGIPGTIIGVSLICMPDSTAQVPRGQISRTGLALDRRSAG